MHVYLKIKGTCMYTRCATIIYFPSGGSVSMGGVFYFHHVSADLQLILTYEDTDKARIRHFTNMSGGAKR